MSCYYCIACQSILHRSCSDRRTITFLKDNIIYCSKRCREYHYNDSLETDQISELRIIVADQQREIKELSDHLEKTKRNSVAFEDQVEKSEAIYKKEIEQYKDTINKLNKKLEERRKLLDERKPL